MVEIRSTAVSKRATLYRMVDGTDFDSTFIDKRQASDDDFSVAELLLAGRPARLVYGAQHHPVKWVKDVARLTGQEFKLSGSSPGAALAIEDVHRTIWVITWGMGFRFLESEQIDFGFGPGVVARSGFPGDVKSLTKTVLDHRARVDRSSLPKGSTVRDLGVDGYGEVVSRIEARAQIEGLVQGANAFQLRAGESLNVPLASTGSDLLADLEVLHQLGKSKVRQGLEGLEQLVALKPRDARVALLNRNLLDEICDKDSSRLGLSWPHERLDVWGPVMSVKITGLGDHVRRYFEDVPAVSSILEWLREVPKADVLDRLNQIRIELHSEAEPTKTTLVSVAVPLRRWLAFEVKESGERFCLHDGNWYRMDDRYLSRIDERVSEILSARSSVTLPPWPATEVEKDYNARAAGLLGGVCLDRSLISTPFHNRGGIEPCDIFLAPGTLVHVKRGRSSADLSHLLAQGLVSTDSLARDENARAAWVARVSADTAGAVVDAQLHEVVLAIGARGAVTVDSMFTFTKVNLVKQVDALRYLGVTVSVIGIPEA